MEETENRIRSHFERIYKRNREWIWNHSTKETWKELDRNCTRERTWKEFLEENEEEPGKELGRDCKVSREKFMKETRSEIRRNWESDVRT